MADPRDDFSPFRESAHMFFGMQDPFGFVRRSLEDALKEQVPSTRILAIRCHGEPKFLTLGQRLEDDAGKIVVTQWATCFQCRIDVETDDHAEELPTTVTLCAGDLDEPGAERTRLFVDVFEDADAAFEEEAFKERFLEFRSEAFDEDESGEGES